MKIDEFNILMPWGHIAVKAWGNPTDKPVLVTHGRMDNAGSFDRLIPHLSEYFYYICIDLPSHGRSSHFPPHMPIHSLDFIPVYKLVLDYFKRGKYILLGHSYGSVIGLYFTRLYPEYVEKLIDIDGIVLHNREPEEFKNYLVHRYNALLDINRKVKTYSKEEALKIIAKGRLNKPLTIEGAECIMKRLLKPAGNGRYQFSTDPRMKIYLDPLHDFKYIRETFRLFPIHCPYLLILGKQSPPLITDMHPVRKEMENWGNTEVVLLDVGHDVHITNPEIVAPYINEFLIKSRGKL